MRLSLIIHNFMSGKAFTLSTQVQYLNSFYPFPDFLSNLVLRIKQYIKANIGFSLVIVLILPICLLDSVSMPLGGN